MRIDNTRLKPRRVTKSFLSKPQTTNVVAQATDPYTTKKLDESKTKDIEILNNAVKTGLSTVEQMQKLSNAEEEAEGDNASLEYYRELKTASANINQLDGSITTETEEGPVTQGFDEYIANTRAKYLEGKSKIYSDRFDSKAIKLETDLNVAVQKNIIKNRTIKLQDNIATEMNTAYKEGGMDVMLNKYNKFKVKNEAGEYGAPLDNEAMLANIITQVGAEAYMNGDIEAMDELYNKIGVENMDPKALEELRQWRGYAVSAHKVMNPKDTFELVNGLDEMRAGMRNGDKYEAFLSKLVEDGKLSDSGATSQMRAFRREEEQRKKDYILRQEKLKKAQEEKIKEHQKGDVSVQKMNFLINLKQYTNPDLKNDLTKEQFKADIDVAVKKGVITAKEGANYYTSFTNNTLKKAIEGNKKNITNAEADVRAYDKEIINSDLIDQVTPEEYMVRLKSSGIYSATEMASMTETLRAKKEERKKARVAEAETLKKIDKGELRFDDLSPKEKKAYTANFDKLHGNKPTEKRIEDSMSANRLTTSDKSALAGIMMGNVRDIDGALQLYNKAINMGDSYKNFIERHMKPSEIAMMDTYNVLLQDMEMGPELIQKANDIMEKSKGVKVPSEDLKEVDEEIDDISSGITLTERKEFKDIYKVNRATMAHELALKKTKETYTKGRVEVNGQFVEMPKELGMFKTTSPDDFMDTLERTVKNKIQLSFPQTHKDINFRITKISGADKYSINLNGNRTSSYTIDVNDVKEYYLNANKGRGEGARTRENKETQTYSSLGDL